MYEKNLENGSMVIEPSRKNRKSHAGDVVLTITKDNFNEQLAKLNDTQFNVIVLEGIKFSKQNMQQLIEMLSKRPHKPKIDLCLYFNELDIEAIKELSIATGKSVNCIDGFYSSQNIIINNRIDVDNNADQWRKIGSDKGKEMLKLLNEEFVSFNVREKNRQSGAKEDRVAVGAVIGQIGTIAGGIIGGLVGAPFGPVGIIIGLFIGFGVGSFIGGSIGGGTGLLYNKLNPISSLSKDEDVPPSSSLPGQTLKVKNEKDEERDPSYDNDTFGKDGLNNTIKLPLEQVVTTEVTNSKK